MTVTTAQTNPFSHGFVCAKFITLLLLICLFCYFLCFSFSMGSILFSVYTDRELTFSIITQFITQMIINSIIFLHFLFILFKTLTKIVSNTFLLHSRFIMLMKLTLAIVSPFSVTPIFISVFQHKNEFDLQLIFTRNLFCYVLDYDYCIRQFLAPNTFLLSSFMSLSAIPSTSLLYFSTISLVFLSLTIFPQDVLLFFISNQCLFLSSKFPLLIFASNSWILPLSFSLTL